MDKSYFDLDLSDWNWDPDKKASFHGPLAHFERSPKLSDEEFIEYCMAPLLEDDTWKQIDLVTEIDFDDIQGLSRRGETTCPATQVVGMKPIGFLLEGGGKALVCLGQEGKFPAM